MYIRSDNHFNITIELIDEIDEAQYVYSSDDSQGSKKSSSYMYERQISIEKNIVNYYQGENFPVIGNYSSFSELIFRK
jgi:hypothetical protein